MSPYVSFTELPGTANAVKPDGTVDFFLGTTIENALSIKEGGVTCAASGQIVGSHGLWTAMTSDDALVYCEGAVVGFGVPLPHLNDMLNHSPSPHAEWYFPAEFMLFLEPGYKALNDAMVNIRVIT
jgi:hypothetical protein